MKALAILLALAAWPALADDAPKAFTFTEAQVRTIAEAAIQKRDAAAAEWKRWNDLLADIQKQAEAMAKTETKEPEKAP